MIDPNEIKKRINITISDVDGDANVDSGASASTTVTEQVGVDVDDTSLPKPFYIDTTDLSFSDLLYIQEISYWANAELWQSISFPDEYCQFFGVDNFGLCTSYVDPELFGEDAKRLESIEDIEKHLNIPTVEVGDLHRCLCGCGELQEVLEVHRHHGEVLLKCTYPYTSPVHRKVHLECIRTALKEKQRVKVDVCVGDVYIASPLSLPKKVVHIDSSHMVEYDTLNLDGSLAGHGDAPMSLHDFTEAIATGRLTKVEQR